MIEHNSEPLTQKKNVTKPHRNVTIIYITSLSLSKWVNHNLILCIIQNTQTPTLHYRNEPTDSSRWLLLGNFYYDISM